jgi:hypothetical protein
MKGHRGVRFIPCVISIAALVLLSPAARAQENTGQSPGINAGDYNIHQSVEFGYRASEINGNPDTYDTFENLSSGIRLFDYTVDMRSIDHKGILFDDLNFSNFGYGGDPNDVTRLRIDKNKWYDFRAMFRRDKNFWDYNLFVNPLNPAALNPAGSLSTGCYVGPPNTAFPQGAPAFCSNPSIGQDNSLHALDLVRRMQDYDLTLLPQSRVRFRLGFSHDRNQGPGFFTTDGGTISDFSQTYSYTTNAYRAGVDFKFIPRTTLSYDQILSYFKQDNVVVDDPAVNPQNYGYVIANTSGVGTPNGTPVDLGNIWSTQTPAETLPCATPIVAGTTNTATPTCNGFLSYSQVGNPRNSIPTERFRFQSNYFKRFEMSGSVGYSSSNNQIPDFLETVNGWTSRTAVRGSTTGGPADAKRLSANADWSGAFSVTDNFRILDSFRYDNWRIPGMWSLAETNIFPTGYAGLTGMQQNEAIFNTTNCPVGPNIVTCPQHATGSAADVISGYASSFLGQNLKSNTFELEYDFTRRLGAHIGYLYTDRTIAQFSETNDTDLTYFPGGATGTPGFLQTGGTLAGNYYLAARSSCAVPTGGSMTLPAGCTLNSNGSISYIAPTAASTTRSLTDISENSLLFGVTARPVDALRISGDLELGYNNASYTRIDPREVQSYKIHTSYKPRTWASLDGTVEIHENRDNVSTVNDLEHDRSYGFSAMFIPNQRLSVDFGYNYWNVYTQTLVCFAYSITSATPTTTVSAFPPGVPELPTGTACPITGASSPLGALSTYNSADHFAHAAVMWKPAKRMTAMVGYGGSFVRGNSIFLNPLTPSGTLDYDYQRPYASVAIDVYRGFAYKMAWNYYGFNETGNTSPFGLAAIPSQDFNGSNATFSFRYAF